jgi:uncharacterized protein YegP (UPF0339 family)
MGTFVLYRDGADDFRFRLDDDQGAPLMVSGPHSSKTEAEAGITQARAAALLAPTEETAA